MFKPVKELKHSTVVTLKVLFWIAFVITIFAGGYATVTQLTSLSLGNVMLEVALGVDVVAGFCAMAIWNQLTRQ